MTEILLSSEDITVFGGPSSLNVEVDFGPTGERGSQIFVGYGKPNLTEIGQVPSLLDLYINLLVSDDEYLYLYQYQNVSGINTWEPIIDLIPNLYSVNFQKTFTDGSTTILIPLVSIDPSAVGLDSSNFNIQHSIVNNTNPVSSSLSVGSIIDDSGILCLPISINAIEYSGTSWSNLSGSKNVHILITVV
jgi:hypothetical protein